MLRTLPIHLLALLVATGAEAQALKVTGGKRVLTVSGDPLLAYHLVEPGQTVTATVDGPQVVSLMLRRHSRGRHAGTTAAALDLDGGEVDRFELPAQPFGRYLGGVGFQPGPRTARQIKLGKGHHRIAVRAIGGAVTVAFQVEAAEPQLTAEPLVAKAEPAPEVAPAAPVAPPAPQPEPPSAPVTSNDKLGSEPPSAPVARTVTAQPVAAEAPVAAVEVAKPEEAKPAVRKHVVLELRGGSASQTQIGSTGWSAGLDARYFVSERFSVGLGADVYDMSLANASVSSSPEAISPLSLGMSLLAIPIVAEAAYDQPLGSLFTLTLGLGVGADYQHLDRTLQSKGTALGPTDADGVAPVGEALAGLAIRAPGGRVGIEVRISTSLPQDIGGLASGFVVGAFLAEVSYQFLL
jgi:hypothetical protein